MKLEKLAALGEIVSSLAIVITLVYLSVQTSQTRNALMANSREAILTAEVEFARQFLEYPDLQRLAREGFESKEEGTRLTAHLTVLMRSREFVWTQYKYGIIDDATMGSYMLAAVEMVNRPGLSRLWEGNKRYYDPEFVQYFDRLADQSL